MFRKPLIDAQKLLQFPDRRLCTLSPTHTYRLRDAIRE